MEPDIREDSEVRNESGLAEAQRIYIYHLAVFGVYKSRARQKALVRMTTSVVRAFLLLW